MPNLNDIPEPFESSFSQYVANALQQPVFPGKVPQSYKNTYPRFRYSVISGESDIAPTSGPSGIAWKTIQIDCLALSDLDASVAREQLRYATQNYRGKMGSMFVTECVFCELAAGWVQGVNDNDSGTYRKTVELKITYYEFVPTFPSAIPVQTPVAPQTSGFMPKGFFSQGYFPTGYFA